MNQPPLSESAALFCLLSSLLIPLAAAGLGLMNAGLGRSRNAAHAMVAALCVVAAAAAAYFVCGFSILGYSGGAAHTAAMGGTSWNWLGAERFFLLGVEGKGTFAMLAAWLGMLGAALAALAPLGAGSERWRLSGMCASAAILGGVVYPLYAHWTWAGGWLAQLGPSYGLGRGFVDTGGAATIQAVGGLAALAAAWITGPRIGKFPKEGMPQAIPGHNVVFVVLGCFLALIGWLGLNEATAVFYAGASLSRAPLVAVNTLLSSGGAALIAALLTRARFGKPDGSLAANGFIGGLVASSAGCAYLVPLAALVIGVGAGLLVVLSIEWLELRLRIDDPSGAISVHLISALWGLAAIGMFPHFPDSSGTGQWLAQLIGIATLLGAVFPLAYALFALANRFVPFRVRPEGEKQGLDLHDLGANAYPELVSHLDDFFLH